MTSTITKRLLGVAGDGIGAVYDIVGIGSCNHDLERATVLAGVGRDDIVEEIAPEGSLDHGSGGRVGATRPRVLEDHG